MSKKIEIVRSLTKGLQRGEFAAGEPLPSEHALMRRYKVSRGTVRAALAELEKSGLVETRNGSGTYPVPNRIITFGVLSPDMTSPFASAVCTGLANCAQRQGKGRFALLWSTEDFPGGQEGFAEVAIGENVAGVFIVPRKEAEAGRLIKRFNEAKIPVIVLGGEISRKDLVCDLAGVNLLANGRRIRVDFATAAAKRNATLLAHGELIGDVALRLMLQRIAYPSHPPCELFLDLAEESAIKTTSNKRKQK